jgi:hypothetical protein
MHGVRIELGATGSLGEMALAPRAVQLAEIEVSGAKPLIDPTTAASATVLDSSVFLAIPTERTFQAIVPLVPGANPSPYRSDGVNVAGATGLENGFFIDGIDATDPTWTQWSMNLPYNFVREVQVTTGGYEAEIGRAQGGVVNVVTNSGGNEWHGEVLGFFTGNDLRAAPRWGVGQAQVPGSSQYDVGGSVGGPVLKDRLWLYAAYNPTFETRDASLPGITTQKDVTTSHLFAAKLTGRLGTATDLALTLLGDPFRWDFVGNCCTVPLPANVANPQAVLGRRIRGGTAIALQARHQLGDRVFLTWSLARVNRRFDDVPRAGPLTDMAALGRLDDLVTNTASGNLGITYLDRSSRTAGQASVTVLAGRHLVKLGAEFELNTDKQDEYDSFVTRYLDTAGVPVYRWGRGVYLFHDQNAIPTVYAEDSWEVSRRLRLNLGLRADGQFMSGDTGVAFWIAPEIAPRLGVVFQPGELGTQKVYASVGRFYEQVSMSPIGFMTGLSSSTTGTYAQNPLVDTTGGVVQTSSWIGEPPDRNLKGQYYDEVTAGYERRLGRNYRVGVRATYRTMVWVVEDGSDSTGSFFVGNPGRGALANYPRARRDYRALELTLERSGGPLTFLASYVLSRNYGNYTGLFATDVGQSDPNFSPQFDFPDMLVNSTGLLPNDRTHVVKFAGSYRFPMGLTVGTSALVASGTPLSEYGTPAEGYGVTFIVPRGTAGRTPPTWNLDLRFAYDLPVRFGSRVRSRMQLDVFNVANRRQPLTYDQTHYVAPDQSAVNPNYGTVTQYQAPRSARLGMVVTF